MRKWLAFVRRDALVAASYRAGLLMSLASLVVVVVPLFFIAPALQPLVGDEIRREGGQYFAFVVAGMATYQFVSVSVIAIPTAIGTGIRNGTFEALLAAPVRLSTLLLGMAGYPFLWAAVRASALLGAAALLGAEFDLRRLLVALPIWAAVTLAYLPFGIMAAALLLVIRTSGPLPGAVLVTSMFLGGVYYPTHVIPSWLEAVSRVVPLTYGLRALRRALAPGVPLGGVLADLGALALLAVVAFAASVLLFRRALSHARHTGSLAQY